MRELWAHQRKVIELARTKKHVALMMGVGVGKTAAMINILREDFTKNGRVRKTLIFGPLSICGQWKKEFAEWSKIPEKDIHVLTGSGKSRVKKIADLKGPGIIVTNYEGIRIKDFYEALLKWSPEILILDEAHKVKDSQSLQSKKIFPLAMGADRRFIMTGTPFLNSQMDIFGQYKILDASIFGSNLWKWRSLHFYDKNAGRPNCNYPDWAPRPGSDKIIAKSIADTSVQARKEDCVDLPELHKIIVPVLLSPEQEKAYNQMEKSYVAEVKDTTITAEFAMIQTLRMRQLLCGFAAQDSQSEASWVSDCPRLEALKDLLEQIQKKKVIIWTDFRPTYKKIGKIAEDLGYKVRYLTGDETATQKNQSLLDFTQGDADCLVINPAAGSAGLNIQEAGYSIYYSMGYSLEHYLQSEGRNYRAGSINFHKSVTHFHLVATGTLDEVIAQALLDKKKIGDVVLAWARNQ